MFYNSRRFCTSRKKLKITHNVIITKFVRNKRHIKKGGAQLCIFSKQKILLLN